MLANKAIGISCLFPIQYMENVAQGGEAAGVPKVAIKIGVSMINYIIGMTIL